MKKALRAGLGYAWAVPVVRIVGLGYFAVVAPGARRGRRTK
jgi:hypothetical protein